MQVLNCLLSLFTAVVLLATGPAMAAPSPTDQARATVDKVMAILKDKQIDPKERRTELSATIRARFDFAEMSQRILAVNWKSASEQQRQRFVALFSDLLERNYIGRIEAYTDQKVDFVKERVQGNRAAVDSLIVTDSNDIPISYRLVLEGDQWKVYDVVIESVSFVNNYRNTYGEILKNDGFDGLLTKMSEKLTDLEKNGSNGKPTEP